MKNRETPRQSWVDTAISSHFRSHSALGHAELEDYLRRARELRAQALRGWLTATAHNVGTLAGRGYGAVDAIGRRAARAIARARQRRLNERALLALDDRLLKDIGLSRSQIRAAVDGTFSTPNPALRTHRACEVVSLRRVTAPAVPNERLDSAA